MESEARCIWKHRRTLLAARVEQGRGPHDFLGPRVGGEDGALGGDRRGSAAFGRPPRGQLEGSAPGTAEARRRRQYGRSMGLGGPGASGERGQRRGLHGTEVLEAEKP